jgi:hypothetical protein
MSTYDKASLVLIPSGTKEGVVFSQKPTNGDGDFTFTRASSATRVNSDGLIEKETQNLILQSNSFDTTWSTFNASATGGQSGYDGSSDAWLLSKSGNQGRVEQTISLSGVQTFSVYAKAGSVDWIRLLYVDGTGQNRQDFDLANGILGSSGTNNIDAEITSIGSGWYRISVTANTSTSTLRIYPMTTDNDTTGTSGSIYIQDAQLNQGLVADSYLETTTTAVYGGITDNIPRLDYTDSSCPALLLEPQRTNLLTDSEYFGAWGINAGGISSIEPNYAISPEGVENAYKVNFVVQGDSDLALVRGHSVTGGATYAYSIYIKGEGSDIGKDIVVKSKRSGGDSAGTTTTQTLTGEWVRVDFTTTYAANNTAANFYISSNDATSCLIYGAQAEAGSYATSYIPTYGASVTFANDVCNSAGNSSTFNDSEGVLYAEIAALADDLTYRQIGISGVLEANQVNLSFDNVSKRISGVVLSSGTYYVLSHIVSDTTTFLKVALKYKLNDISLWINGVEVDTEISANTPINLNELNFSVGLSNANKFYGKTKQILYFPTALTDEELADLTTI